MDHMEQTITITLSKRDLADLKSALLDRYFMLGNKIKLNTKIGDTRFNKYHRGEMDRAAELHDVLTDKYRELPLYFKS